MSPGPYVNLGGGHVLVSVTELLPAVVEPLDDLGAVVAAHALIDVYAVGAHPVLAVPFAVYPSWMGDLDLAALWPAIAEPLAAAGAAVATGRATRGAELLVGLSVQGLVDARHELAADDAQVGDVLVLSKPIGTEVVLAAGEPAEIEGVVDGMTLSNRIAADRLVELAEWCRAVVGIGRLGLVGHAHDLAERSGVDLVLDPSLVPCYRGAKRLAGADPADGELDVVAALAAAPETSGGLLAAVHPDAVDEVVEAGFRPIGAVVEPVVDVDGYLVEPLVSFAELARGRSR